MLRYPGTARLDRLSMSGATLSCPDPGTSSGDVKPRQHLSNECTYNGEVVGRRWSANGIGDELLAAVWNTWMALVLQAEPMGWNCDISRLREARRCLILCGIRLAPPNGG